MMKLNSAKKEIANSNLLRLCLCAGFLLPLGSIPLSAEIIKCPTVAEIKCKPSHGEFECRAKTHPQKYPDEIVYWRGWGDFQNPGAFDSAAMHGQRPTCHYDDAYLSMVSGGRGFQHGCQVKGHNGFECS